ncbi:MAG: NHL repeat-containing protein [SAR324 cluster bacterium]|nr:NHL repeat-containing protein [SAR324 cluster bacterium]
MKTRNADQHLPIVWRILFVLTVFLAGCDYVDSMLPWKNEVTSLKLRPDQVTSLNEVNQDLESHLGESPFADPSECPPGASVEQCPVSGTPGPVSYRFWVKNSQSTIEDTLASFTQVDADFVAQTPHFVLYLDNSQKNLMTTLEAQTLLNELETGYDNLQKIYGLGNCPDVQKTGRIVVLAVDIKDDYSEQNPEFLGGFFAPRDLYKNSLTSALYEHPENLATYGTLNTIETAENLRGYSNENQILYMDLNPFYNGKAFGGTPDAQTKGHQLAIETALHEASHMCTYYHRIAIEGVPNHIPGVAEALAEQAPQLTAGLMMNQIERMTQYSLSGVQNVLGGKTPSLFDLGLNNEHSLTSYLQSNLFFNYLRHRAGSHDNAVSLMNLLVSANEGGIQGVVDSLKAYQKDWNFSGMFGDWVVTNWLMASGRSLTRFQEESGKLSQTGSSRFDELSYQNAGIAAYGKSGVAFQKNALPLGNHSIQCLPPASYVYLSFMSSGVTTVYIPEQSGMDAGIKVAKASFNENNEAEIAIYAHDAMISLNQEPVLSEYHLLLWNAASQGECLSVGRLPYGMDQLVSWIGGGKSGWQIGPGAEWGNMDSYFYRTRGVAVALKQTGTDKNYVYVSDSINHGISRWDLDSGVFEGRLGNAVTDCASDNETGNGWKTKNGKLVNNHCRRSFNSPQGLAVDSAGNIYIADRNNYRIVKWDKNGNFVAWLGDAEKDTWQDVNGQQPAAPTAMGNVDLNVKMFNSPWGIAIDETSNPPYLYVTSYGSSRVSRRNLTTGAYAGFIGNGQTQWNQTVTQQTGSRKNDVNYFSYPKGITVDTNYIYVADEGNHRISRWTKAGTNATYSGDGGHVWLGGGQEGWHATAVVAGSGKYHFDSPGDVSVDDQYLYVADRKNQRVSRWEKDSGRFAGWLGSGTLQWEEQQEGPSIEAVSTGSSYPVTMMLEPESLAIATTVSDGSSRTYLNIP